ncbi:MAG: biotin/lipoyl-binding protein [Candidatus Zixiibacteriota bacterium]|nr:MAG: biotin/lipoyl-binding protein [candidate division Zixibacteria bacterium]
MPRYQVIVEGREFDIEVVPRSGGYDVRINNEPSRVVAHRLGDSRSVILVDSHSLEVDVRSDGNGLERTVFMRGLEIPVAIEDYNLARMRKAAGLSGGPSVEATLRAPMPGLVIDVRVKPGQNVSKGDPLLVIEAMKMENIIKAKAAGIVKAVHVAAGESVEKTDLLLEFE